MLSNSQVMVIPLIWRGFTSMNWNARQHRRESGEEARRQGPWDISHIICTLKIQGYLLSWPHKTYTVYSSRGKENKGGLASLSQGGKDGREATAHPRGAEPACSLRPPRFPDAAHGLPGSACPGPLHQGNGQRLHIWAFISESQFLNISWHTSVHSK